MSSTSGTQVYSTTTTGASYTLEIYGGSPKTIEFEQVNTKGYHAKWYAANGKLFKVDWTNAVTPTGASTLATSGVTYDRTTRKITVTDSNLIANGAEWVITCTHG